jgi:hypothetical protein
VAERWHGDDEFTEARISVIHLSDNGEMAIEREGDWGQLWIGKTDVPVREGMVARYYSRGSGLPVRGILIDGQCVRYDTSDEHEAKRQVEHERFEREMAQRKADAKAAGFDEREMRETDAPWPKSLDELTAYIQKLADGPHDYGTAVYAMSLAATAAFQFMASHVGASGFQASCADLDVLRRTRRIDGPFSIVQARDLLYPQYDLHGTLSEWIEKWRPWVREQARAKLASEPETVAESVRAHWARLAEEDVKQ